jgi:hypothetical protein
VCGGSLSVFTRTKGRYVQKAYGCVYYHKRGTAVCTNSTQVGMDILDSALLHSVREVLDEQILEEALQRALHKIDAEEAQFPGRRLAIERELSLI